MEFPVHHVRGGTSTGLVISERWAPPERELPGGVPGVMKALSDHSPEEFLRAIVELMHEMDQRGMKWGPGSLVQQA